ncbi:hypothetical protein [Promicromonospora sp. NPDC023987]|uniref:hypothetical protein n=1 Tax=Promicromonospora sp. NPDC023987 TaxID=3155360 RepID=UPI0033E92AA6
MDRNIRRVLYTALVAGGLVVVGASSAYAAGDGLLDPVTQETTGTTEEAPAARGGLDAADGVSQAGARADAAGADAVGTNGEAGVVDELVGPEGIVRSLLSADVAAVVDGTLGDEGLVDDLVTGDTPGGVEGPLPEGPDTGQPGTVEPDTEEPGTDPATGSPGIVDPPGTDEPGTDEPGTDEPGTDEPGTDGSGAERPGSGGYDAGPRADRPGTGKPGTDRQDATEPRTTESRTTESRTTEPRTTEPRTGHSGGELPSGASAEPIAVGHGAGDPGSSGTPGTPDSVPGAQENHGTPAAAPRPGEYLPAEGVDLAWGGTAGPVPTSSSGTMLASDDLDRRRRAISTEPEAEAEPAQQVVPDATLAETGHMITGQLSLVSLLLGLGIAALRMRRR